MLSVRVLDLQTADLTYRVSVVYKAYKRNIRIYDANVRDLGKVMLVSRNLRNAT